MTVLQNEQIEERLGRRVGFLDCSLGLLQSDFGCLFPTVVVMGPQVEAAEYNNPRTNERRRNEIPEMRPDLFNRAGAGRGRTVCQAAFLVLRRALQVPVCALSSAPT